MIRHFSETIRSKASIYLTFKHVERSINCNMHRFRTNKKAYFIWHLNISLTLYHWSKKWHQKSQINNYNLMNQGSVECLLAATAAAANFLQPINFSFCFVSYTLVHSFPRQFIKSQIIKRSTSFTFFWLCAMRFVEIFVDVVVVVLIVRVLRTHTNTLEYLISFGSATDSFLICRTVCVYMHFA